MTGLSSTDRSTVQRGRHRAVSDRVHLHDILDTALICHLSLVIDGSPRVLPTGFARVGDTLYLHGSTGARSLREASEDICVAVTLLDGVVYSRSAFHFSMNYRSAVIHGQGRSVTDSDERWEALRAITEHLAPGSWDYARKPTKKELAATSVVALELAEAAVKIRTGGPGDDEEDIAANSVWAGVLPLRMSWGEPEHSADLPGPFAVPPHVRNR